MQVNRKESERESHADLFHARRIAANISTGLQDSVGMRDGFPRLREVKEDSINGIGFTTNEPILLFDRKMNIFCGTGVWLRGTNIRTGHSDTMTSSQPVEGEKS
jgi:hypothetical protein